MERSHPSGKAGTSHAVGHGPGNQGKPEGKPKPRDEAKPKNIVHSVAKVFSVLKAFDAALPELTVTEVAARAGLDRGTAFRFIHTLLSLGYLAPGAKPRRYRLTLKCLELGYAAMARADLKALARPLLRDVVPAIADAASLGLLDGPDVLYIERAEIDQPTFSLDRRPGARTGAYAAALGHAILARLPVERQRAILQASRLVRLSERTLVDADAILARLAEVRARGYAISDGENAYGLRTVAAAVLDGQGAPVAGVSLTVHSERMAIDDFVASAGPVVTRIAADLTHALALGAGTILVSR